jgi:hypothetical protein
MAMEQSPLAGHELELFRKSVQHATANHTGEALDAALDELGWSDALAVDQRAAVSTLFEMQGAANATSSALGRVVTTALGLGSVEGISETFHGSSVVLPAPGLIDPPGELAGEGLAVRGLGTAGIGGNDAAVVVARAGDEQVVATVDTASLGLRPIDGLDPGLGLVEVTAIDVPAATRQSLAPHDWGSAVAAGQRSVAHELVGAARQMLTLARDHAIDRVQFGRPIASFQAVRHRLADTLLAIESADAALTAAWDDGSPQAASMAKAMAGRGSRLAARHCQQVLAGIGFTTEHPLHLYIRRVLVLDRMFGDARSLTRQLGRDLIETRRLPALLPL